jgi:Ala-tRNA(Pro) deacylase
MQPAPSLPMQPPKTSPDEHSPSRWTCEQLCAWFAAEGLRGERLDHPPVFTAEEAQRLVPPAPGAHAKNLLVEEPRRGRVFMVTVPFGIRVDLSALAQALGAKKLRFVEADRMMQLLGITPGSVSMLALVNDPAQAVSLVLDRSLWEADAVQCHPLVNTATLVVDHVALERFLAAVGHAPEVLDVPRRLP